MAKITVTPVSRRAQFKFGKKTRRFGDEFEADEKDKRIAGALKIRVLKKVHNKAPEKKPVDSTEPEKNE